MAKNGMTKPQIKSLLRNAAARSGWTLCVGAGISRPAFPDWDGLVRRLAARDSNPPSPKALEYLQNKYSSDALIQAAMDRLGLSDEQFADILATELFADIIAELEPRGAVGMLFDALSARHISVLNRATWQKFIDVLSLCFPGMTAIALAKKVAKLLQGPTHPAGIISFNAESLFGALINAHVASDRGPKGGDVLDYVVHATSERKAGRIPYILCHGLLPVPGNPRRHLSSVDKLVFQETAYLQLANTSFSWQSASFLRAAAGGSMVFIGVSLTDPNMRRWLSWVHATRVAELTEVGNPKPTSTVHYWITKTVGDPAIERWTESVVAHLGVRLIWVENYADIVPTLDLMTT